MNRELHYQAWEEAQKELESARCMFNYSNNPYYTDIAMELEDVAKKKLNALATLQKYESLSTTPVPEKYRKQHQAWYKKLFDWFIEPFEDIAYDVTKKPLSELTWVDLRKFAGFTPNPVENYDDLERGNK